MKRWMTRLARAAWGGSLGIADLRLEISDWPASNRSVPSNCASAMPPNPPPKRQRNSRREPAIFTRGDEENEGDEFIGCENSALFAPLRFSGLFRLVAAPS